MDPSAGEQRAPRSPARALTLLRYRGVPVRLDWSWLIIAGLAVWLLHGRISAQLDEPTATVAAVVTTVLFFASLLVHELGHTHTSLDRGIPVRAVTLFLLGGVTESTREAQRARDELIIVGAGPFLSFTLAAAFGLAHSLAPDVQPYAIITGYLAWANLLLAVFNVIPAFPLDGGRLLRSLLWAVSGRPHSATRWAARTGQALALGLGALGLWLLFGDAADPVGGVWTLLIAAFLFKGAADAHRHARLREGLAGRTAADVMGTLPEALDPEQPLHRAVLMLRTKPSLLWPVGDPLRGVVRLADLERVDRRAWSDTPLSAVTTPSEQATVRSDATLDRVVPRLADAPGHMLVVVGEDGRPRGLLTPSLVVDDARP